MGGCYGWLLWVVAMGGCYGWMLWVDADWCLQPNGMPHSRLQACCAGAAASLPMPLYLAFRVIRLSQIDRGVEPASREGWSLGSPLVFIASLVLVSQLGFIFSWW